MGIGSAIRDNNTSKDPAGLHAACQTQAHQQTALELEQTLLTFT